MTVCLIFGCLFFPYCDIYLNDKIKKKITRGKMGESRVRAFYPLVVDWILAEEGNKNKTCIDESFIII